MQRIEGQPWWEAPLAIRHPGYFKVVLSLIFVHVAFGLDALRPQAAHSPTFAVLVEVLGGQLWIDAVLHFIIGVMIFFGLYAPGKFWILRFGSALSAVLFNASAVALASGAYITGVSYFAAISCVALSLSSIACAKEPVEGPAKR